MNIWDRLFGPRLPESDVAAETEELEEALVKHERTLRSVDRALSKSQKAVLSAIDDTAQAIADARRRSLHQ